MENLCHTFFGAVSVATVHGPNWPVQRYAKRLDDPVVRQALNTCAGATMLEFARYPFAEVERQEPGYTVILRDARYERERKSGFGVITILADEDLKGTSTPGQ